MSDGRKRILIPFTVRKKWKAWNKTREKYAPVKKKTIFIAETDREPYYKEEWLKILLDSK